MGIWVLRYGHRVGRDARASMHVALTARALGADGVILCGEKDDALLERIKKIVQNWGGCFKARYSQDWRGEVEKFKKDGGCFVHLTMYGQPVQKKINAIRKKSKRCLVLVGSQKVPIEAYHLADYNVAVTNQPHSEIAALAVFSDRYFEGKELGKKWSGKIMITPADTGKRIMVREEKRKYK